MNNKSLKTPERVISALGLILLTALFVGWLINSTASLMGKAAALLSAVMFAILCLRFVPVWVQSWRDGEENCPKPEGEKGMCAKIFVSLIVWDCLIILLAFLLRRLFGCEESFAQYLNFWTCTDSRHYLDIARDWYLSAGDMDRLVQLVFLPGYPIAVRAVNALVGNYLVSGLLVSALCFAGAGCVFYKLLRLDVSHETAIRALALLCVSPAAFFFAAPMSESLFLLLCLACIYLTRRGKILPACIFGALASFTRSLGVVLIVPVLFELISTRAKRKDYFCLCIIPLGFAAYCLINLQVSGDAFKFMEYQSEHWGQHIGLFFNTAAYQTDLLIESATGEWHNALGLWLPNLLAAFMSLGIVSASAKKLRPSYTAFFIAYFAVAIGATWLLSAPRYLGAMFVLYIALAYLTDSRKKFIYSCSISTVLLLLYLCAFVHRWQVW